jgi:hypothetical protein
MVWWLLCRFKEHRISTRSYGNWIQNGNDDIQGQNHAGKLYNFSAFIMVCKLLEILSKKLRLIDRINRFYTRSANMITKDLTLPNPGGTTPSKGLVALSDAEGNLQWGNLLILPLDLNLTYPDKEH